jgi:hypothetical protein
MESRTVGAAAGIAGVRCRTEAGGQDLRYFAYPGEKAAMSPGLQIRLKDSTLLLWRGDCSLQVDAFSPVI